jgi:hypothetical protein
MERKASGSQHTGRNPRRPRSGRRLCGDNVCHASESHTSKAACHLTWSESIIRVLRIVAGLSLHTVWSPVQQKREPRARAKQNRPFNAWAELRPMRRCPHAVRTALPACDSRVAAFPGSYSRGCAPSLRRPRGISRSIRITSGRRRSAARTACSPSSASPATSMPGSRSSSARSPLRTTAWSSTNKTRILYVHACTRARRTQPAPATGCWRHHDRRVLESEGARAARERGTCRTTPRADTR